MTHIPAGIADFRPKDRWVQDVNEQDTAPPYSPELIQLLQRFECGYVEVGLINWLAETCGRAAVQP